MKSHKRKKFVAMVVIVAAIGAGLFAFRKPSPRIAMQSGLFGYADLIALPEEELAKVDIALMNLLSAEGLPGAENLDFKQSLHVLDQWAEVVRRAERKYLPQFHRNPSRYDHSLAKFKAVNLGLTLKQDLGCDYNKTLVTSGAMADLRSTRFFRDSSDLFLHGFIEKRQGSCASLPVLMVAIGRRCGYPLYLVASKGHLFCRWDDGRERFNIETAIEGVDSKPDSYYRKWPHPFNEEDLLTEKYLKNLSPAEELGIFAQLRAACLEENGRFRDSAESYEIALRSFPESKYLKTYLNRVKGEN